MKKKILGLLAILCMLGLDRAVKLWAESSLKPVGIMPLIPGFIQFFYTENTGAAFGLFSGARIFLIVLPAAAVVFMVWLLLADKLPGSLGHWSLVFIIGGALGNFFDRVFQGYVVDMFEFMFVRFAIFNVADIFVTCGGVMLVVYLLFFSEKVKKGEKPQ